jgi:hypothetical protein
MFFSITVSAGENESCWGGPYWTLMEKSQRICQYQEQHFGNTNGVSCYLKYHNDPNVCYSQCIDAGGKLVAKLRVDMTSDCTIGIVNFVKIKTTWYR